MVSAIDGDGHVVSVALVPNITEDDSMSGCSNADPSKYIILWLALTVIEQQTCCNGG